jgi:predicted nucleic acid-binding protein
LNVCVDSSFLASLYAIEVHSSDVRRRMARRPQVWVTPLNRSEMVHAFYNQVFRSKISAPETRLACTQFAEDCTERILTSVELPAELWETCINIGRDYCPTLGIRTLDLLHVACAMKLGADKFWTFDERQEKLAQAVGLDTKP